jgi:hypothetical protein
MRLAMDGFSAVARIARPMRVRWTSSTRPPMVSAATAMIMIWRSLMDAPISVWGAVESSGGNER